MAWKIIDRDDKEIRMINPDTGTIKRVPFASDAQMAMINRLRAELNMPPAKSVPPMYRATATIDRLKNKIEREGRNNNQQKLI